MRKINGVRVALGAAVGTFVLGSGACIQVAPDRGHPVEDESGPVISVSPPPALPEDDGPAEDETPPAPPAPPETPPPPVETPPPVDDEVPPPVEPAPAAPCAAAERFSELLSRLEAEIGAAGIPGASAAVVCLDGTVVSGGVGQSALTSGNPVDGQTRFQIASVTKLLTAATAFSMERDGLLDRSAPASTLLEGVNTNAPYAQSFTLEELLAHSAGYPTDVAQGDPYATNLDAYFATAGDVELWSEPGAVYNYSNYGYALAGLALERAGDAPYDELVRTHLLEHAGLEHIEFDAARVHTDGNYARGHTGEVDYPQILDTSDSYYDAVWYAPMGGAWASAEDLGKLAALLLKDGHGTGLYGIGSDLSTPRIRTDISPDVSYGQGLFVDNTTDVENWYHGGGVAGFTADIEILPEQGFGLVLLFNADWAYPNETFWWAMTELGGFAPSAPVDTEAPTLSGVVGRYVDSHELGRVDVYQSGGGYKADFVDLGFDADLTITDDDTVSFYYSPWGMEMQMAFWRDDYGNVKWLSTMAGVAKRE